MAYARIDPLTREITIRVGRIVPPRDARATLHRILDEALDMLATETPIPAASGVSEGEREEMNP